MHANFQLVPPAVYDKSIVSSDVQISDIQSSVSISSDVSKIRSVLGARADNLAKLHLAKQQKPEIDRKRVELTGTGNKENPSQLAITQPDSDQQSVKRDKVEPPFPAMEPRPFTVNQLPYILTTEIGQLAALEKLRSLPPLQEGLLLGFAFEFNYHLLAERAIKFAWICDINKKMHDIYNFIQRTIITSDSRKDFIEAFRKEIEENEESYFGFSGDCAAKVIEYYLNQEFSWLHSDEKYSRIRNMYLNQQIHHVHLDLAQDSSFFADLKKWADFNKYTFDVIYVANIPEWLQRRDSRMVAKMKANLLKIMSPETKLVDAKQVIFESGEPEIRITQGIHDAESFPPFVAPMRGRKIIQKKSDQISGMARLLGL